MKAKLLLGLALLAVLVLVATRGAGRAVAPNPPGAKRLASSPAAVPAPSAPVAVESVRDPFRYGDAPTPAPSPGRSARVAPPPAAPPPPAEPAFRLVGIVTRDGRLCAALSIGGEVVLLAPGESAGGVTVLAVQEDGVRLRSPDGRDEVLPLP